MATLSTCIRRAGKALNRGDADAIREIYDDLRSSGVSADVAAPQAIDEYMESLDAEQADIETQVRDQGGRVPGDSVVRLAADNTVTKRIARKLNVRNLLSDKEDLKITPTGEGGVNVMRDVARALQDRAVAIDPGLQEETAEVKEILATNFADETEAAMRDSGHAGHWYSDKIRNAVALAGEIYPILKTDPNKQSMFLAALAITSNGQPVAKNAELADAQFAHYLENGKFMEDAGVGKESEAMNKAFKLLNKMLDARGEEYMRKFLATEYTKGELKLMGFPKAGGNELVTFNTHGSAIFGPKVGSGFYQNLIGNFNPLTADRWFMRTWGRMVGKLMEDPDSSANQGRRERLRAALSTKEGQEKLTEMGYNKLDLANDTTLADIATLLHMEYARTNFEDKSEWNLAAKNLDQGLNDTIAAPSGGKHRAWIREVATEALEKLQQRGVDVDMATMQALVWYPEKELYAKYGVGDAKAAPTDYEQEFSRIAAERGVDAATIQRILRRKTGRGPRGVRSGESETFEALRETIDPRERRDDIAAAGARDVRREQGRQTYTERARGRKRPLLIDGAQVVQTWRPLPKPLKRWPASGNAARDIHQLDMDETPIQSAEVFHKAISDAMAAHPEGAAVFIYDPVDYQGMQLFLDPSGKAGFALKDDDIVSVFKHPDLKGSEAPNISQSLISFAVQMGGRRLDAFDTILPKNYSIQGFKVASRLKWDPNEAPPNWPKEAMKDYNNGEPDVVFMYYDPENFEDYAYEGEVVQTYEEAVELQDAAVRAVMYPDSGDIRLRIEDEVAEEFGDRHPKHPHSQLFKMAMSVEDQAHNAPSMVQHIKDSIRNRGDAAINTNLALVHRNYLADFQPEGRMDSIKDYNRIYREMDGRKNVLTERYDETARKMFFHKTKNRKDHYRLGEAMFHSTLNQMDPTKPYKPLKKRENMSDADKKLDAMRRAEYKVLKDYFDTQLTPEARELYAEVRDQYAHLREQMQGAIRKRIEDAEMSGASKKALWAETQQMFEQGRMEPYFPLDRWGDLYGVARDENGDVFAFSKFESRSERDAWEKSMKEAGFDVQVGKKPRQATHRNLAEAIDPKVVQKIIKLTQDAPNGAEIADDMYQLYLRSLPEVSMRKQFIHRKGRPGYSNNIMRSFAHHAFHGSMQIARMEYRPQLEDAMRRIEVEAQESEAIGDKHSEWAQPIFGQMLERHDLAMNPPQSQWAGMATGLGFGWLLGMSPGAALLNLFQTPMFAMPTVAAREGNGPTKTTIAFAEATKEYFTTRFGTRWRDRLRGDELDAYEYAHRTGIFQSTRSHDLADLIDQSDDAYGIRRNAMTVISWMFHNTEQANRQVTFMAAYRLARSRGLNHQDALYDAADLNDRSHYDYGSSNRPPLLQKDFARVVFLFKNYGLHSAYQLGRAFNDGVMRRGGQSKESKDEQRRKFVGIMMMTAMLGGISGVPMAWIVEHALNMALGDDDEPYDAGNAFKVYLVKDMGMTPEAVNAIMNGGWNALTGTDMSSRISLSYLGMWREPYKHMEGAEKWTYMMEELMGPVPSIIGDFLYGGPADIAAGNIDRGIEKMMPKFARDVLKTWRFANEGAMTYKNEPILTAEEFTNRDLFAQAMGITPGRLALRYEANQELRNVEDRILRRQKYLRDRFFMAIQEEDNELRKEVVQQMLKFNKANPSLAFNYEDLMRSARARARQSLNTFGGVNLNPRLNIPLRDRMTWLPVETGEPRPPPPKLKER